MEFKVGLPLEDWFVLAPGVTTELAREFPFGFPFGGILMTSKTRKRDQIW
jgi:hypothetical protein